MLIPDTYLNKNLMIKNIILVTIFGLLLSITTSETVL